MKKGKTPPKNGGAGNKKPTKVTDTQKEANKKGKNQHVTPHKDGWAVKGAGNKKPTIITDTQKEAIKKAEDIAKKQKSDTKIHGKDGKIRAGNSYGNDPHPPKDKK